MGKIMTLFFKNFKEHFYMVKLYQQYFVDVVYCNQQHGATANVPGCLIYSPDDIFHKEYVPLLMSNQITIALLANVSLHPALISEQYFM